MTQTAETTEVHETLDAHVDLTAQIALYRQLGNFATNVIELLFRQIGDFGARFDTEVLADLLGGSAANPVNVST